MTTLETIASRHLARLVEPPLEDAATVDLDANLVDVYGLTSLTMMLLITSICDETGTDLSRFTDDDVARLKTLRGIVRYIDPVERVEC